MIDTIFDRARVADGTVVSIAVAGGRIASIETAAIEAPVGVERVDLDGALVVPGLIDGHIHLDKTFVSDRWRPHRPCTSGFNVRERVAFEKEFLADAAPVETRAASLIELAVSGREAIAERTKEIGMGGRVAVSLVYAWGAVSIAAVKRTAGKRADAGVGIMTKAPGTRVFPPILALRDEGVTVFVGNDNIRD